MPTTLTAKSIFFYFAILGTLTALLVIFNPFSATTSTKITTTGPMSLNVFKRPLAIHSTSPMTGFLRNGYCEVPPSDAGNHAVAAIVTDDFLSFSAARGNDLRTIGLKGGCKWCLCASRWKEAFDARKNDNDSIVPKVVLNATNSAALNKVQLEDLKKFAVDKES